MSTNLITYLHFIAGLENATDEQINQIIKERQSFILLGKSDMKDRIDSSVNSVFNKIDSLAKQLEEEQIAQESVRLAEDAAAVAAIWSFGLSMAVFAPLAVTDISLGYVIRAKEKDLNNHLASADKDIADKMGSFPSQYIDVFKKNNDYLKASSPAGLTPQTARSYLYNFMDYISMHGGVGLANFRKYIDLAKKTKDDKNIKRIYDILDEFALSNKGPQEIKSTLTKISAAGIDTVYIGMVRGFTYAIWMYEMNVSSTEISTVAKEAGIPREEVDASVLKNMDTLGKATAALTIMISIVDAALNVYNIVETVERYRENVKVFTTARGQYKDYYKNVYDASVKYQAK